MAVIIGSARIGENGSITGGKPGDQKNGTEVSEQNFYIHSKGWYVLRPKDESVANNIGDEMHYACNTSKMGYNQLGRYEVVNEIKKVGTFKKLSKNVNSDCSSTVRSCIIAATGKDVGDFNTSSEVSVLEKSGLFEKHFAYTASTKLYKGDVLVTKTKGHTVAVTKSDNVRSTSTTSKTTSTKIQATSSCFKKYAGSSCSIVEILRELGSDFTMDYRKKLAKKNNISGYKGTAQQNEQLVKLAKAGTLKKA